MQIDQLQVYLAGIDAGEFYPLFQAAEITSEILPFITKPDLLDIGIPNLRADEIVKNLENFRPEDMAGLDSRESEIFHEYSAMMSETDAHSVRANAIQHVKYLTAVVRKINSQVQGYAVAFDQ